MAREYSVVDRLVFGALLALVLWMTIPLGSNRAWSTAVLEAGLFGLMALLLVRSLGRPALVATLAGRRLVNWVIALGVAWLAAMALQLLPLGHLFDAGSTDPGVLYGAAPPLSTDDGNAVIPYSVDRGTTLVALLKYGAYLCAFVLVVLSARTRQRALWLAVVVVLVCVGQSLYGIAVYVAGPALGWWDPRFSPEGVAGTYVNQNHYAGLVVIGMGMALGLLRAVPSGRHESGLRGLVGRAVAWLMGPSSWLTFALVIMATGLVLSASRGALGALVASTLIVSLLMFRRRRRGGGPGLLLVATLLGAALFFGGGDLVRKLDEQGFQSNRVDLAAASMELVLEHPWLGSGAGTFRWQFPIIRNGDLGSSYYQHVHNDWLEMGVDVGVLGAVCLFAALGGIAFTLVRGLALRRDAAALGMLAGSAIGAGAFVLHAMVDFNFNIPANAVAFFIALALGVNAASRDTFAARDHDPYKQYGRRD